MQGLINGLRSAFSSLQSVVTTLANGVSSTFRNILKIHSPSKLFYSFGEFTVQGFNNAIDNMAGSTKGVVDKWARSFGDMKANLGFTVDYSGFDGYRGDDYSDFVASATSEIQSNIDGSSGQDSRTLDYDRMGYVCKEPVRKIGIGSYFSVARMCGLW